MIRVKTSRLFSRGLVLVGLGCLILLTAINTGHIYGPVSPNVQIGLLLGAVFGLAWGFSERSAPAPNQGQTPLFVWGVLVGVILLGAGVRLWQLENAVHFYVDEGNFVEGVNALRDGGRIRILSPFNYIAAFTWTYPYLQELSSRIFGANLMALRVVSVAFGLLTIPALYRLGTALFNRRIGLIAAFMLAVYPPHIHFSRIGLNNIADPLFGTLALAFLISGMRNGRKNHYVIAGVMLGLTQYFYEGGRLLFPALAFGVMLIGGIAWRPPVRRLLLMVGLAGLIAAPVYITLNQLSAPTATRLERRGLEAELWVDLLLSTEDQGRIFRERLWPPLAHFINTPDESEFYYGGETALILPALLPVLALGLLWALTRSPAKGLILILWVLLTVLGNSLIFDNGWSARFVVAFPGLALILALGLWAVWRLMGKARLRPEIRQSLGLILLILVGVGQIGYYFGPHLALYNRQIRPEHDHQDIVFRARDWPENTRLYLITDDYIVYPPLLVHMMHYWGIEHDLKVFYPQELAEKVRLERLPTDINHAFFIQQNDPDTLALLRSALPEIEERGLSPYNVPPDKQFLLLYLPSD